MELVKETSQETDFMDLSCEGCQPDKMCHGACMNPQCPNRYAKFNISTKKVTFAESKVEIENTTDNIVNEGYTEEYNDNLNEYGKRQRSTSY